jgi:DUF1680 family protein
MSVGHRFDCWRPAWPLVAAFALSLVGSAAAGAAEVNLAVVARASASHTSGDTTVDALNNGDSPRSSLDNSRRSYGNWPRRGTQWVEYEWPQAIATNRVAVYWWDDRRGVRAPAACRLLWWNGTEFAPVANAEGLGVRRDRFNETTFDEVKTTRLRLEIDGDGEFSTGVLEWHVFDSGASPKFPPRVEAGVDRTVVIGGNTYLDAAVQTLGEAAPRVAWSKQSGPGGVTFADASAAKTTAAFDAPGDYTLAFVAKDGDLSADDALRVRVVAAAEGESLRPVATGRYRLTSPLWKQRTKALIVRWIPHCIERISDPELREGGMANFDEAAKKLAGQPAGRHREYVFANAWVYNTVESICLAIMIDPQGDAEIIAAQEAMRKTLDDWIPRILAAQEPDGYIQTAFTLSGNPHWERRGDHEGYVAGYFLEMAIAHSVMTDRQDARLYDAAKKLADCWVANIGPPPKRAWYDGHQEMEQALMRFGRFVNEVEGGGRGDKYRELAKFLLDQRGGGSEYDQSHAPVVAQYEAVGHAVRAAYSYSAMADVVLETGNRDYQSAIESLWDNTVNKKYYVTGGIGSGETSEGFGPDYSLPNGGYCESCSSCGEVFFQHKFNLIRGDAKYADLFEETLYNAILGSIDLAGENFYYDNPLDAYVGRYAWHVCPCCVGNIPRTLLSLPTWMYATGDDALYVNLYLGSEVTVPGVGGTDVTIVQETNYPWDGAVKITVNPRAAAKFAVRLRAPRRDTSELYRGTPAVEGMRKIKVNGATVEPAVERGYATIEREWRRGDVIELELPMTPQRVHASDKIAATRGRVALRYGPLMYNIEAVDQPIDGALPRDAELATEWRPDLLEGVVVIKTKFADGRDVMAIPNFARFNRQPETQRGAGGRRGGRGPQSIVWIREAE